MKIKDIKSDEVRDEAVRLAIENTTWTSARF
jgi:hypothetical protein